MCLYNVYILKYIKQVLECDRLNAVFETFRMVFGLYHVSAIISQRICRVIFENRPDGNNINIVKRITQRIIIICNWFTPSLRPDRARHALPEKTFQPNTRHNTDYRVE